MTLHNVAPYASLERKLQGEPVALDIRLRNAYLVFAGAVGRLCRSRFILSVRTLSDGSSLKNDVPA
jgi:hypothetical protein